MTAASASRSACDTRSLGALRSMTGSERWCVRLQNGWRRAWRRLPRQLWGAAGRSMGVPGGGLAPRVACLSGDNMFVRGMAQRMGWVDDPWLILCRQPDLYRWGPRCSMPLVYYRPLLLRGDHLMPAASPHSREYGDVYHAADGARGFFRYVFPAGNVRRNAGVGVREYRLRDGCRFRAEGGGGVPVARRSAQVCPHACGLRSKRTRCGAKTWWPSAAPGPGRRRTSPG